MVRSNTKEGNGDIINEKREELNVKALNKPGINWKMMGQVFLKVFYLHLLTMSYTFIFSLLDVQEERLIQQFHMNLNDHLKVYYANVVPTLLSVLIFGFVVDLFPKSRIFPTFPLVLIVISEIGMVVSSFIGLLYTFQISIVLFALASTSLNVVQYARTIRVFDKSQLPLIFALQFFLERFSSMISLFFITHVGNALSAAGRCPIFWLLIVATFVGIAALFISIFIEVRQPLSVIVHPASLENGAVCEQATKSQFKPFMILLLSYILFHSSSFQMVNLIEFHSPAEIAAVQMSKTILFYSSMIAAPLFGVIVWVFGGKMVWLLFPISIGIIHPFIVNLDLTFRLLSSFTLGLATALSDTVFWSLVPMVISTRRLGTVYGLTVFARSILTIAITGASFVLEGLSPYLYVTIAGLSLFGIAVLLLLYRKSFNSNSCRDNQVNQVDSTEKCELEHLSSDDVDVEMRAGTSSSV